MAPWYDINQARSSVGVVYLNIGIVYQLAILHHYRIGEHKALTAGGNSGDTGTGKVHVLSDFIEYLIATTIIGSGAESESFPGYRSSKPDDVFWSSLTQDLQVWILRGKTCIGINNNFTSCRIAKQSWLSITGND